jgi:hypothetical protein
MMNSMDKSKEFEALWDASLARSEGTPDWYSLTLEQQKALSSKFRRDMNTYGGENPMGNRMDSGLYGSPPSSKEAG